MMSFSLADGYRKFPLTITAATDCYQRLLTPPVGGDVRKPKKNMLFTLPVFGFPVGPRDIWCALVDDACYRKLYILCIESRYLPNNTHNNKHTPMNMYDIRPVLLSLRRMLALSLSVGNYSTAESWRSLLAPRCWRCACCLFSFGLSLARCFSSDFTRSFLITPVAE